MSSSKSFVLSGKLLPSQERSRDTYEAILETAGDLLGQMGFEQLTTNLICKRANLTPPALYRYFPNKYAVLKALGDRLMKRQDDIIYDWVAAGGLVAPSIEATTAAAVDLHRKVVSVTQTFPGGLSILRAMRAVPILHALRLASRDEVAERFLESMKDSLPNWPDQQLRLVMRLMVELQNAATEMAIEEGGDIHVIASEAARMFILYIDDLRSRDGPLEQ